MNILILIKLLVAHIIGDFFLQTDTICEGKNSKGFRRLIYLAIHSGINAALAYLLVGMLECWLIPVVVFVTHYIIDYDQRNYMCRIHNEGYNSYCLNIHHNHLYDILII